MAGSATANSINGLTLTQSNPVSYLQDYYNFYSSGGLSGKVTQFAKDNPDFMPTTKLPVGAIGKDKKTSAVAINFISALNNEAIQYTQKKAAEKAAAEKAAAEKAAAAKQAELDRQAADKIKANSSPGDMANQSISPAKRKIVQSATSNLKVASAGSGYVGSDIGGALGTGSNSQAAVLLKVLLGQ